MSKQKATKSGGRRARLPSAQPDGNWRLGGQVTSKQKRIGDRIVLEGWEPSPEVMHACPHPTLSVKWVQWMVAGLIESNRPLIESNGQAVLDALCVALRHGVHPPRWVAQAFLDRLAAFQRFETPGLDAAFDVAPMSARARSTAARRRRLLPEVSKRLVRAIALDPDRPIDEGLFEEVGAELGIGKSACAELYYLGVEQGHQDLTNFKELLRAGRRSSGQPGKSPELQKRRS